MEQSFEQATLRMIQDMQKRQKDIAEQMKDFNALQEEIAELKRRAPNDASARSRLEKLAHALKGELAPLNARVLQCANRIEKNMETLKTSLKATDQRSDEESAPKMKAGGALTKSFF